MAKKNKPRMPGGANPMGMMQQIQQLQQQVLEAQNKLAEETVSATAGGGVVKITVTGDQRCVGVEIAPEVLEDADAEMLQDLVSAAVNEALKQSQEMMQEEMGKVTGGMNLPGMF